MNRVFYIFRHGETDWNREGRCQGHTNTSLNENGNKQALELAQKLLDYDIELIVSSDLDRALNTGTLVANTKKIPLKIDHRLREMSYGEAEGMLYEEAVELFGEEIWQQFQCFKKCNDQVSFPGGETRFMARERFHNVLLELIETTNHQTFGISTHGGALRNILHSFLPEDHTMLPIPNCVVYKIEYIAVNRKFIVDPLPL